MSDRVRTLGWLLLALALALSGARGWYGIGKSAYWQQDFDYFYAAGVCWRSGGSPYDAQLWAPTLARTTINERWAPFFAYPPTFAPVAVVLATMPIETAHRVWTLVDILSLAILVSLCVWLAMRRGEPGQPRRAWASAWTPYVAAAAVLGGNWTTMAMWMGQSTLLVAAALVAGWVLIHRGRPWLGGMLLALAAIKPQFALLPVLWLLLDGRWRALLAMVVTCAVFSTVASWQHGPVEAWSSFLHGLSAYKQEPMNGFGHFRLYGLPSLLAAMGGPVLSMPVVLLLALTTTAGVWQLGRRLPASDTLGLVTGLSAVLIAAHPWDLVLLAPLVVVLCFHLERRPRWWLAALALWVAASLPTVLLTHWGLPLIAQSITLVLLASVAMLLAFALRDAREDRRRIAAAPSRSGDLDRAGLVPAR